MTSVRRVSCACGRRKTVRAHDTADALARAGWRVTDTAGAWRCPLCAYEQRHGRYTIVTVGR